MGLLRSPLTPGGHHEDREGGRAGIRGVGVHAGFVALLYYFPGLVTWLPERMK